MDVAKYIGLFLLKNKFVYIHGLGNLELRKKPAVYNGEALQGGAYEVVITPSGSIDDNLANFIATNEQISISKASNALREFSTSARAQLSAGKLVEIPAIGSFSEEKGKIVFISDQNLQFTPPAIPSVRVAKREEQAPYVTTFEPPVAPRPQAAEPEYVSRTYEAPESPGISWVKIALVAGGLFVLVVAIFFGVRYMRNRDATADAPLITTLPEDTLGMSAVPAAIPDSMAAADSSANTAIISENGMLSFDVVINTYDNAAKANDRVKKLSGYGNNVELVSEEDSSAFYVVIPIEKVAPADTSRLLDSLKRTFNPSGIYILQ